MRDSMGSASGCVGSNSGGTTRWLAVLILTAALGLGGPANAQTTSTTTTTTTSADGSTTTVVEETTTSTQPPTTVVVSPAPVYGPAGVVGQARRAGRRTARRTAHRHAHH